VFTRSAMCDVPTETVHTVTGWLWAHQQRIGTRRGRRAGTVRAQAKLVLRFLRDDARLRVLATEAGIGISTAYRYLHDGIADHAPDLHQVLARGHRDGWSHVCLDGTLINTDRVATGPRQDTSYGPPASTRPRAPTSRSLPTPPGSPSGQHPPNPAASTTSPPPAPTASAPSTPPPRPGYPPWLTRATTAPTPASTPRSRAATWPSPTPATTPLLTALRTLGERANAELTQRWRCLRRIRLCPHRIGDIVAATIVLSTPQRGNY